MDDISVEFVFPIYCKVYHHFSNTELKHFMLSMHTEFLIFQFQKD